MHDFIVWYTSAMEQEHSPKSVIIRNETFSVVKPERLLPGMVLRSQERPVYARLGPTSSTLEQQIHTVSLYERGFPVAKVLESGKKDESTWYFTEESLGDKTFSEQFKDEYQLNGAISDETYHRYFSVLKKYTEAQFDSRNRTSVSIEDFLNSAIANETILANFIELGGDTDRYLAAIQKAATELHDYPMGVLQYDLNPFNILDGGVIDFELVGYGPIGYDILFCSRWHRWFTSDPSAKYHLNYRLSKEQIDQTDQLLETFANEHSLPNPSSHFGAFALIKSAWGFSSNKRIDTEPESKRAFYTYRAKILEHCIDHYLADKLIDTEVFQDQQCALRLYAPLRYWGVGQV